MCIFYEQCFAAAVDSTDTPDRVQCTSLLVNCALDKRNAQLLCGDDGAGLALLFSKAFERRDALLMKVVRNIAFHNDPLIHTFVVVRQRAALGSYYHY